MNKRRIVNTVVLILPVLIWFSWTVYNNAKYVAETGTCLGITPRPCTVIEYLTLYAWNDIGMALTLFFAILWWGTVIPLLIVYPATRFLKANLPAFVTYFILGLCLVAYIRFLVFVVRVLLSLLGIFL
jgi:hypothetical protein